MNILQELATTVKGISLRDKDALLSYFGNYWQSAKPRYTGYVSACLNTMGNYFAKAKFRLYEVNKDQVKEIYDHPFLELLENPNDWQVENELKHYMGEFFGVFGNFYLLKQRGSVSGKIRSLQILDPQRVTPITTKAEPLAYYEYHIDGKKIIYQKSQLIHLKYLSAYSNIAGQSVISAIKDVLDIDAYQTAYMQEFYQNNGFLGATFTTDQLMTNANFERAKKELQAEYGKGAMSHKIALFDSGIKPVSTAYSLKDMEMTLQRKLTLSEVMTQFRIPKLLLGGDGDSYTFATAKAQEYTYASTMVDPALTYIDQILTKHVKEDYGKNLKIIHDPVSPKDVEENIKYKQAMTSIGGLTVNENRVDDNYEKFPYELCNVPLLNVGGAVIRLDTGEQLGSVPNNKINPKPDEPIKSKAFEKPVLDLHWKQANRRIDEGVKFIQRRINEFFDGQKERLLKVLDLKSPLSDTFFDSLDELAMLNNMIENAWARQFERALSFGGGNNINDPRVRGYLQQFLDRSRSINETSKKEISNKDLTRESIEKTFKDFKDNRSQIIAQTTSVGAFNFGLWLAYKQQGHTHKTWVSQRIPETRDSHLLADGQRVKIDEFFVVGSSLMMFPGDSTAPAEEVINCLCVLIGDKGE